MDKLPVLYKYTQKGQIQQWEIIVKDDHFYTIEGIKGGKLTTSLPTYCKPKNVGRSNETTKTEQALLEAKAKHQKKKDSGYNDVLTTEKTFFSPMLAKEATKDEDIFKNKVFIQPKLDGLRSINQQNSLMSRNGKPFLSCPHLYQDEVMLDGEMYNHDLKDDFNKIVSLVKKQKPTLEQFVEAQKVVEFWAYDFPLHKGKFSERYRALKDWHKSTEWKGKRHVKVVETYEVGSWEEIDEWHAYFMEMGYEGSIIRLDIGDYECKRSKQLLKYKDFKDEEFEIITYEEGEGGRAGTIGFFWMWLDKSKPYDLKNQVNCFKSNVKGDFDYLKKVWKNRDAYRGKEATVKYFNRTPTKSDGIGNKPRFPYIIKINREEYE